MHGPVVNVRRNGLTGQLLHSVCFLLVANEVLHSVSCSSSGTYTHEMAYLCARDDPDALNAGDGLVDECPCQIGVDRKAFPVAPTAYDTTHGPDGRAKEYIDTLFPEFRTHLMGSSQRKFSVPAISTSVRWKVWLPVTGHLPGSDVDASRIGADKVGLSHTLPGVMQAHSRKPDAADSGEVSRASVLFVNATGKAYLWWTSAFRQDRG